MHLLTQEQGRMILEQRRSNSSIQFLVLSVLLHALLLIRLDSSMLFPGEYSTLSEKEKEITIHIEQDPEVKDKDDKVSIPPITSTIVSPSDIQESREIPKTSQLSDKSTFVEKEQLKRGRIPDSQTAKTPPTKISTPGKNQIKNIFLDPTALAKSSSASEEALSRKTSEENIKNREESSADRIQKFIGRSSGNSDYLPHVPDGDITMLNAKADRFAVFVRRVALQVFSSLRTSDWTDHPVFQKNISIDEVTIRAIMDRDGKFISATIISGSNQPSFDQIVLRSVKKGAWDKNPPEAALTDDGTIKFIFKSKAWVRSSSAMHSRKWILLGTGLE
jgi:outer membrane biosynthesis protein TonB